MNRTMTAGDLCTRDVVFTDPQMALQEAARLMREQHVGCLVVVDPAPGAAPPRGRPAPSGGSERSEHGSEVAQGRVVVGMLTDRDIVTAVVAKDLDTHALRVGDAMSENLVTARETDSLLDVLAAMEHRGVRRVPVTNAHGQLVGLLALDDVLGVAAELLRTVAQVIETERKQEQRTRP
jgi:CBS domain-containing protein